MDYCGPRGIALSAFLAWDEADQQVALEWSERDRETCGNCGTHRDDFDPRRGGHRHAHIPEIYVCPGCAIKESALESTRKSKRQRRGIRVRLRRNPALADTVWRPFRRH